MPGTKITQPIRRLSALVASVVFLRALIPIGFMAVGNGEGWFSLSFCPQQAPEIALLLGDTGANHHHHHHDLAEEQLDQDLGGGTADDNVATSCGLLVASSTAVEAASFALDNFSVATTEPALHPAAPLRRRLVGIAYPRAPPA